MATPAQIGFYSLGYQGQSIIDAVPASMNGYEAASQTYGVGAPLIWVSGKLTIAVALNSNIIATSTRVIGVATTPASGTVNTRQTFNYISGDTIFKLPVNNGGASQVTAYTQIGTKYQLRYDSVLGLSVDIGATSTPVVEVLDIAPEFPVGEAYGLVYCRFLTTIVNP